MVEVKRRFSNKNLKKLIIPLIIEQLLAVTVGFADTIMVSNIGETAVSAVSLVDTAKMLFGESENIAAYSLEPGDDIDKYREAFVETINEFPEGSMILVDLFGGTPCNQVMRHIQETEKPLEVVGGMNLPMLVNAVLAREGISGKDFSLDTVENGKNGIFRVDTEGFLSDDDDEDDE